MNFVQDYAEILRQKLNKYGVVIPSSNDRDVFIQYFELQRRWFNIKAPCIVVYSQELLAKIPTLSEDDRKAIKDIESCFKNGNSVTQYMSRLINNTEIKKSDFLVKNWNIYHLHLETLSVPKRGFSKPNLLFFQPKGYVVHFIDVKPHPHGDGWFDRDMLEIVYSNWPWLLNFLKGVSPTGTLPDNQIHKLTKRVNVLLDFHGGALMPSGFGVMASGIGFNAVNESIKLSNMLHRIEDALKRDEARIRKDISKHFDLSNIKELDYKLVIENDTLSAEEIHSKVKVKIEI